MYESFFRFNERPFAVLPDSDRIFWTDGHRNAFSVLELGLDRLSQVTVLTGGIGTGKTTLIRYLLQTASTSYSIGLLSNFAGQRGDLLPWVLSAFGLNTADSSEPIMYRRLERFFSAELDQGRRSVLIIDEAQNLAERDLETLRLLGNMNTGEVLMMLVLVGQPQLRAKLTRAENRRLCQRIGADYHLEPLTQDESARFVRHRCVRAGGSADIFDEGALDEVHRITGGIPRKINVLCDLALVSAYADGVPTVDYRTVRSVIDDARGHGTYMSLTEHDIAAVEESSLAVGAENQPLPVQAVRAPRRDPVQRLTLVLESGADGPRRHGPAADAAPHADARAQGQLAHAGPSALADLNVLFDMTWSDDTLMFVSDPVHGNAEPDPAAEPADSPSRIDRPADAAAPRGAGAQSGDAESATGRAVPGARPAFAGGRGRHPAAPASASSVVGAELALRRAFAPRLGLRRVNRRAAVVALAACGSMAAAFAVALLPDGALPPEALAPAASGAIASDSAADRVAAPMPDILVQVAAADAASMPSQATAARAEQPSPGTARRPGNSGAAASLPEDAAAADGARFSPAALSLEAVRVDEAVVPSPDATASSRPSMSATNVRLADAAWAGEPAPSLPRRSAAEPRTIRLDHPPGLGLPDSQTEASPAVSALHLGSPAAAPVAAGITLAATGRVDPAPARLAQAHGVRTVHLGTSRPPAAAALPGALPVASVALAEARVARDAPARPTSATLQRTTDGANPADVATALETAFAADRLPVSSPAEAIAQPALPPAGADPETVFRAALDVALNQPRAAVVGYARAALHGHERAAYYLGQIYETGDGVPVDLAIARHWYEAASEGNARAQDRLAGLPPPERGGATAPPLPLLAHPIDDGRAEFVWTSGQGADPSSYVVEISADLQDGAAAAHAVTGSAALLPLIEGASHWRVLALDAAGGESLASGWQSISAAGSGRSAAAGEQAEHL